MMLLQGTTNGYRFSERYAGSPNLPNAVVPFWNIYYGVHSSHAKRVAKARGAFGFWRVKK